MIISLKNIISKDNMTKSEVRQKIKKVINSCGNIDQLYNVRSWSVKLINKYIITRDDRMIAYEFMILIFKLKIVLLRRRG